MTKVLEFYLNFNTQVVIFSLETYF